MQRMDEGRGKLVRGGRMDTGREQERSVEKDRKGENKEGENEREGGERERETNDEMKRLNMSCSFSG